jgi:hypothetical protein
MRWQLLLAMVFVSASAALAADIPRRKSGAWETQTTVQGMTSSIRECVDANSDSLTAQFSSKSPADCSTMELKPQAGGYVFHSVCKVGDSTATSDGTIKGSFESAYTGEVRSRFDKPIAGMTETTVNFAGRWVGPCKAGEKPGSAIVTLPGNMGTLDLNDPKTKEMLDSLKGQLLKK